MSLQKTWGNIHLTALGAMMLSFLLVGCDDSVAQNAAPPAPTVSAAKVLVKSISQWDSFNGRIEAVESVQLRPRVSGYIDKVNYTDGQEVKKGQVLFTIDDRTYRAALEQAQAALARAKTQASLAQSEANRTDKLVLDFCGYFHPAVGAGVVRQTTVQRRRRRRRRALSLT